MTTNATSATITDTIIVHTVAIFKYRTAFATNTFSTRATAGIEATAFIIGVFVNLGKTLPHIHYSTMILVTICVLGQAIVFDDR